MASTELLTKLSEATQYRTMAILNKHKDFLLVKAYIKKAQAARDSLKAAMDELEAFRKLGYPEESPTVRRALAKVNAWKQCCLLLT